MSRVDLHPEDLLSGADGEGTLTADDRARLEEHLASCDACAFERAAVRDFAAALEREEGGDRALADEALAGALEELRWRALPVRGSRGRAGAGRMSRVLLVAAVALAAGVAAAAGTWYAISMTRRGGTAAHAAPIADASSAVASTDAAAHGPAQAPPRGPGAPQPAIGTPEPAVAPPPPAPIAPDVSAASHPHPRPPQRPVEPPVSPGETAQAIFARANTARRVGDYEAAARAYDELGRRFPGSREEVLSRATLGTLLLQVLGQPQRALGLFDSYLAAAPGGALVEEALVGRAVALGRLGRNAEERAAWEVLLAQFPASSQADRARQRLEELQ